jgi:hypothetical protein
MKPSKRIDEITDQLMATSKFVSLGAATITAILQHLDEQYEANKPCEHEEVEDFRGMDCCKKCHVVGYFPPNLK